MPPKKGENSKAVAAKERKSAAEAEKRSKQEEVARKKEDEAWAVGTRSNDKERLEAEKRAAKLAAKKEREALEAKEAKELDAMKKAKPSAATRGEEKKAAQMSHRVNSFQDLGATPEYEARSIDAALDLLTIATTPVDPAASTDKLDRHPERRMKAAYAAYEEKNLPLLKEEYPGLRLSQLKERLFKQWQKAPENPMNQVAGRYDLNRQEEVEIIQAERDRRLESMRVDPDRQERLLYNPSSPSKNGKAAGASGKRRAANDDDADESGDSSDERASGPGSDRPTSSGTSQATSSTAAAPDAA